MKPRLLVATSTFPAAQAEHFPRFVLDLSARLAEDFDVIVLAPHLPGAPVNERIEGVRVVRFRYLPERWERLAYGAGMTENLHGNRLLYLSVPFYLIALTVAIHRMVRREQIQVIHAHWWLPQALCTVITNVVSRRPVPIVCTLHGADVFAFKGKVVNGLMRWVLRRCHTVCAGSGAIRDAVMRRLPSLPRPVVAPMGVDLQARFVPVTGVTRDPLQLVFVGRLVGKKGVEWLLRAFQRAHQQHAGLQLQIIGSGPRRAALEALAAELGVAQSVHFLGNISHDTLPRHLSAAAIAVVPSVTAGSGDQEGLGLSALEAVGCGCATIVSDAPAFRDFFTHMETGIVVPQGDIDGLDAAIMQLATDRELVQQLSENARVRALLQYDWGSVSTRYRRIIDSAV